MHRRDLLKYGFAALSAGCAAQGGGSSGPAPAEQALEAAFYYGFPLYEFTRIEQERTGAINGRAGSLNAIRHRGELLDHTSQVVTAPNNDTIYSSAFFELSGGPIEIEAPSSATRYYSVAFMHAFTDNFAYIGTRATRGRGGRFWLAGPQWRGAPPEGTSLIRSPTNDVWMLMRTLVDGAPDLEAARAFQAGLSARAVSQSPPRPFDVAAVDVTDPTNFLAVVNDVIARSPGRQGPLARSSRFAAQGVAATTPASPQLVEAWRALIPSALQTLRETFLFRDLVVDGWSYQPPGVGDFGENDRLRAAVALGGIAALGEEEAMYFHANFDADGAPLTGASRYIWRVPPGGVPADAFWSLTAYRVTPEGRYFFAENPINRYAIGDRTLGLNVNGDGSLDIIIQRQAPEGAAAANWLPAPEGRLRLALRAYLPRQELRRRAWRVPALRVVSP